MRDITALMYSYGECCRNLWSAYFTPGTDTAMRHMYYERIRKLLFESLVVNELHYEEVSNDGVPLDPVLKVVPRLRSEILVKWPVEPGQATCWGEGGEIFVEANDIDLTFIEIWGFHNYPIKDFRYFLCKIVKFPSRPEFEEREVLIEALECHVFDPEWPAASPIE
jgi:hypothetical protein